jgi:hypothetical protein
MPKIALLNKAINERVDPNRSFITTSGEAGSSVKWIDDSKVAEVSLKRHFSILFSIQLMSVELSAQNIRNEDIDGKLHKEVYKRPEIYLLKDLVHHTLPGFMIN